MNIFFSLMVLWIMGLGLAMIIGQRRGASAYVTGTWNAIRWMARLLWRAVRWGWRNHREGFVGFLLGVLVTILVTILIFLA